MVTYLIPVQEEDRYEELAVVAKLRERLSECLACLSQGPTAEALSKMAREAAEAIATVRASDRHPTTEFDYQAWERYKSLCEKAQDDIENSGAQKQCPDVDAEDIWEAIIDNVQNNKEPFDPVV